MIVWTKTTLRSATGIALLLLTTFWTFPFVNAGNEMARRLKATVMEEADEPTTLKETCGELTYEILIAVKKGHFGIYAHPSKENAGIIPEACGPVFMHTLDPATKVISKSSETDFLPGAMYPIGDHKMEDVLAAFDSVPVSMDEYDVIANHCALLVLKMMCTMSLEVVPEMADWAVNQLIRSGEIRMHMVHLMKQSKAYEDLGVSASDSKGQSIRKLVEYDIEAFQCAES